MTKLFYILSFTWGIIMNLIGAASALIFAALGHTPTKHGGNIVFKAGHYWGGVSLGIFTFVCEESDEDTLNHEFGHSLQNCIWGPLFPFVIGIPSFIRCQKFNRNILKGIPNEEDYYAIWYEKQASEWGAKMIKNWK